MLEHARTISSKILVTRVIPELAGQAVGRVWSDTLGRTGNQLPPLLVEAKTCRKHAEHAEHVENMQKNESLQTEKKAGCI